MINRILSPTGDVFYIDLTKLFDLANVPYVVKAASPFSCAWCQSAIRNNQSKILFFARVMIIPDSSTLTDSIVYSFDIKTQTWSTPLITGMIPSRRRELQPVSDQNGKIYDGSDMSQTIQIFATMNILDSVSYIWITGSQLNSPLPRIDYTATLLPNGNIIYIRDSQSNLNVIHFDNVNMNETSTMATGATITSRTGHTVVLNKKGKIIIYGGVYSTSLVSSEYYNQPLPMETENITKTAIYKELPGQSDQLYILDINTFTWVRTFNPPDNNPEPAAANELQLNNSINTITIILIVVAVVLIAIGSTIDADSIFTSKSNVGVPRDMHQFNGDIKQHQYIATYNYGGNSNAAHHYSGNNNATHHYGGNNNMAHQYRSNNNSTHHYGGNNQYATDTNITPAHETFNVSPDQPFGVVMLNTQSGEMIIPSNVQTTSNYMYKNIYIYIL
ncbi:hypothetical protein C1645_836504 [Glomus cerebriforme]|uniref:Galactose oxidase n=1 Tax=Glomus cerebriforme TaxID=658196 RepID=A0A397S5R7_9GLOM|nr:hypothetical protein C1645_836504 [Glomus cerebriforme]